MSLGLLQNRSVTGQPGGTPRTPGRPGGPPDPRSTRGYPRTPGRPGGTPTPGRRSATYAAAAVFAAALAGSSDAGATGPVMVTGKGIVGGALLGGEVVTITMGAAGLQQGLALLRLRRRRHGRRRRRRLLPREGDGGHRHRHHQRDGQRRPRRAGPLHARRRHGPDHPRADRLAQRHGLQAPRQRSQRAGQQRALDRAAQAEPRSRWGLPPPRPRRGTRRWSRPGATSHNATLRNAESVPRPPTSIARTSAARWPACRHIPMSLFDVYKRQARARHPRARGAAALHAARDVAVRRRAGDRGAAPRLQGVF